MILTWRVREENPTLTDDEIYDRVQAIFPGRHLCFIRDPPKANDTTGEWAGPAARVLSECSPMYKKLLFTPKVSVNPSISA